MVDVCSNLSNGDLTPEGLRALAAPRPHGYAPSTRNTYQAHQLTQRLGSQAVGQVIQRNQQGESATRIAADIGVSPSALLRLIREQGAAVRRRGLSSDQVALLASEYEGGATMPSSKLGIPSHTRPYRGRSLEQTSRSGLRVTLGPTDSSRNLE